MVLERTNCCVSPLHGFRARGLSLVSFSVSLFPVYVKVSIWDCLSTCVSLVSVSVANILELCLTRRIPFTLLGATNTSRHSSRSMRRGLISSCRHWSCGFSHDRDVNPQGLYWRVFHPEEHTSGSTYGSSTSDGVHKKLIQQSIIVSFYEDCEFVFCRRFTYITFVYIANRWVLVLWKCWEARSSKLCNNIWI